MFVPRNIHIHSIVCVRLKKKKTERTFEVFEFQSFVLRFFPSLALRFNDRYRVYRDIAFWEREYNFFSGLGICGWMIAFFPVQFLSNQTRTTHCREEKKIYTHSVEIIAGNWSFRFEMSNFRCFVLRFRLKVLIVLLLVLFVCDII